MRLNRLHGFGYVQRMEGNRIPQKALYMNLEATRLTGRPRNRWQDEVREDGRQIGGKGWKERVYNIEEWKKRHQDVKGTSHSADANGMNE